jgi:hypothetical protein
VSVALELTVAAQIFAALLDCQRPYLGPFRPPRDLELTGAELSFADNQQERRIFFRFSNATSTTTVYVHWSYLLGILNSSQSDARRVDSDLVQPLTDDLAEDAASLLSSWVDEALEGPPINGEHEVHLR